jgi:DNA-binding winged helix-turn-helix (wHTH) protein
VAGHRFGEFELSGDTRQLLFKGTPVHLSPKAFQLLLSLVEAAPRALSKPELQEQLWPGTFVLEANLQHLVSEIRGVLRDQPRRSRFVRTVHGFGYAFEAPLETATTRPTGSVACRLRWDGGRIALGEGEYILGRDPAADVVLDSSTVSRHHARIRISAGEVTLEDLGSKNGSYVSNRGVEGRLKLADGDDIRIGMVPLRVRISVDTASTETAIVDTGLK